MATEQRADVIPVAPAIATWAVTWFFGSLLAQAVLAALDVDGDDYTIAQLALAQGTGWAVFLAGLTFISARFAAPDAGRWDQFVSHFALRFRPIDLVGVPIGVALQLVVVPLLYVPLRAIWPDTFSTQDLEERAQELADKADGRGSTLLLFLLVVVGAPIVEELVYRGLLQRSVSSKVGGVAGVVLVSVWFALVHLSPVEYPGLLVAGLTFGTCLLVTKRLGASMLTHFAFNAAGLALALR